MFLLLYPGMLVLVHFYLSTGVDSLLGDKISYELPSLNLFIYHVSIV